MNSAISTIERYVEKATNHRLFFVSLVTVAGLANLLLWIFSDVKFQNDDQFILYRYIDNLLAGEGFVYNIGEKVLGSTTPLFTIVVAAVAFLLPFLSTPTALAFCNIAFFSFSAPYFHRVSSRFLSKGFAALVTFIYILLLSRTVLEGMETSLFLLLLFAALSYLYSGKHVLVSILIALLVLTRPDAGIIAILIGIFWIATLGMRETVRLTTISVSVFLVWAVFATCYFGSFIPQSLLTKLNSGDIYQLPWYQAAKIQIAHISKLLLGRLFDFNATILNMGFHLTPIAGLIVLGASRVSKVIGGSLIVSIPLSYLLLFSLSNPIIFPWYLSQTEPFWILLIMVGVERLLAYSSKVWVKVAVLSIIILGPLMFYLTTAFGSHPQPKATLFEVGTYLKEHIREGESVGIADIGIVGYMTGAYVHDFIGLVSPSSVAFYRPQSCIPTDSFYTIPPLLINHTNPDYVVGRKDQLGACFYNGDAINKYALVFVDTSSMVEVWRKK